jgi:hypothetical protein
MDRLQQTGRVPSQNSLRQRANLGTRFSGVQGEPGPKDYILLSLVGGE